jgi:hypothetical protein
MDAPLRTPESRDEARSRPMVEVSVLLGLLSIIGLIMFLVQRDTD